MITEEVQAKIVLLGDSGSGKSSLINRYKNGVFSAEVDSTIGASFYSHSVKLNGKTLKLSIWDTAGQERYDSISSLYSRNSHAVILVTDACKEDGLSSIEKWYNKIVKEVLPEEVLVYIAINKCDLVPKEKVFTEISDYAKDIKSKVFLTSAKDGINVSSLFDDICNTLIQSNIDLSASSFKLVLTDKESAVIQKKKKKCC
jgi:small GTP-binding protein